jgi:Flp pilus assembly protein CpaB
MSATPSSDQSQGVVSQGKAQIEGNSDNTQSPGQTQMPSSEAEDKKASKSDGLQISNQVQAAVPLERASQLQVPIPQGSTEVDGGANNGAVYKVKRPFDPFPIFYWLLFVLLVPTVAIWMAQKTVPQVGLPVLNKAVPAYYVITKNDISVQQVDQSKVLGDIVRNGGELIGHYTLVALQMNQPIHESQIAPRSPAPALDVSLITNTLATAIPASNTMILGGNLQAGDVVKLAAMPNAGSSSANSQPVTIFERVLVLDVKSAGNQSVIILAIPADRWLDYLAKTHNATLILALEVT